MSEPAQALVSRLIQRTVHAVRHHFTSLAAMAMRLTGVAAGFVVMFLIGRWYGPVANGQYAIVTQTGMFLSVIAVGGLDLAVTREFSKAIAESRKLARSTMLRVGLQAVGLALVIMTGLLIGGDDLLALLGREGVPKDSVRIVCLIVLARTLTRITAAMLRSQTDYVLGQAVELLFIPLITIALLIAGVARTVEEILWATAAAGLISASIGVAASLRHSSTAPGALQISSGVVFATAIPIWGMAVTQNLADWYALAAVSAISGLYDAGLFRVAAQYASVFSIVSAGLFGTFATQISAAFYAGDKAKVAQLAGSATRLSAVIMLPIALLCAVFARQLLTIIGPEFAGGERLLQALVIGQIAIALSSPASLVLALTGHPRMNFAITACIAVVVVALAPFVVREFGTLGAAIFVSLVLIGGNLAAHTLVRRLEGINALTGKLTR